MFRYFLIGLIFMIHACIFELFVFVSIDLILIHFKSVLPYFKTFIIDSWYIIIA